ncbi:MAG: DUF1700 domain-containing protein [Clostridiales bacterium]
MNRKEFLAELYTALGKLPDEERNNAISYYNEYFDEAGIGNEEETIKSLGPIKEIAARLNAEFAMKEMEENPKSTKKGLSAVWIVILAILATPIALPLGCLAFAFILIVLCMALGVICTIWGAALSCILGGIVGIFGLIFFGLGSFSSILMMVGLSLVVIGLGILLVFAAYWITKWTFRGVAYLFNNILNYFRQKGSKKNEQNS